MYCYEGLPKKEDTPRLLFSAMKRTVFTLSLLLALAFIGPLLAQRMPNILIITVDDMNYNSCGVLGSPVKEATPQIDQLARQGRLFNPGVCFHFGVRA